MRSRRRCARRRRSSGSTRRWSSLLATIDPYRTVTGYRVTPVIGVIPPDLAAGSRMSMRSPTGSKRRSAISSIAANQHRRSALFQGRERHYYEIDWNGRQIWGATAAMIVNLSRRLRWR